MTTEREKMLDWCKLVPDIDRMRIESESIPYVDKFGVLQHPSPLPVRGGASARLMDKYGVR